MRVATFFNFVTGFRTGLVLTISLLLGIVHPSPMLAADAPFRVPRNYEPTQDEFDAVSKALVELLQSRDASKFAKAMTPSAEDWKSILSTNRPIQGDDPLKGFENSSRQMNQAIKSGAKELLARADALHLDFSKGELHPSVIMPRRIGSMRYNTLQAKEESLPFAQKVEIVLHPDFATNNPGNGDFKIALLGMVKFPGGWRSDRGVQWEEFPSNVVDEKTRHELALLDKVAARKSITGQDDPALLKLGEVLVHFIQSRDLASFQKEALPNGDMLWAHLLKLSPGYGASRKEVDGEATELSEAALKSAQAMLKQMDDAGIDLKNADIQIKQASIRSAQSQGAPGSLDGLVAWQYKLDLAVKTGAKAKNGASLAGDYVLSAKRLERYGDDWKIEYDTFHWSRFPAGVLDEKAMAALELENYVSENGTLPPHMDAPEIEFITLDGGKKMKLSDLRGKVVVLDFWATWCGPCQEPMAHLQTLRKEHPNWQDKVAIVPLSIDDTMGVVQKHVDKRGWTNTFNVWAGDGGWHSQPATTFRVTGVPTTYIIDRHGQIVKAGHPAAMNIGDEVEALVNFSANSNGQ